MAKETGKLIIQSSNEITTFFLRGCLKDEVYKRN